MRRTDTGIGDRPPTGENYLSDKHRPKGLEFPACADCNRQTSADEALLAFVCRFAGSHRTNAARDFNRLKDIVGSVNQSFPGLRQKMHGQRLWAMERGVWVRIGAIDVNQPEVNLGLCRIAAKLALAIYYESRSSPASKGCRINTQWTHCQNAGAFKHVQNTIQGIPSQAILQMGKWNTQDSFFLKCHDEDGLLFSAAIFHQSVALIAQLREPGMPHHEQKWQFIMSPLPGTGITVLSDDRQEPDHDLWPENGWPYVVEFRTAEGETLAISIPRTERLR